MPSEPLRSDIDSPTRTKRAGSSMAGPMPCPHIAGIPAFVEQHLREFRDLQDAIDPLVRLAPVLPWVVLGSGYFWHQFPALECAVFVSPAPSWGSWKPIR